jgi:hypothetical protein
MKTIDEILDGWYPTIPDEEHNGLYAKDKVKLIAQEFADQFHQPPLTNQKLWEMAKLITDRQKKAKELPTDKISWTMLEETWFDWLEEELFGESKNEATNGTKPVSPSVLGFGDYCAIEQHRYGCDNEHYTHKVIGRLRSNTGVDVPVMHNAKETQHDHMEDVVACVCCGVSEREILRYRLSDVRKHGR